MSENLQNLLRESLLNNSYDYNSMHNVLRMTWENSYSYLYNLQKNYVEFEDLEYISNDTDKSVKRIGRLYNNKLLEACFDVDYDFIHVCNREEFRNSEFYFKDFTFYNMINNPEIFNKIPIIIIDDQCIWDYKIRVNKKMITVTLPFKRDFVISLNRHPETDALVYLDHNIRILVVDNVYYQEFTSIGVKDVNGINKHNPVYHYFDTKQNEIIDGYGNIITTKQKQYLIIDVSSILEKEDIKNKEGIFFISINKDITFKNNLKTFYSSSIIPCKINQDETNGKYMASFLIGDDLYNELTNIADSNIKLCIHLLFINKLYNYLIDETRHKYSPYYNLVDEAGSQSNNINCTDIICDENNECNIFMLQFDDNVPYAMPIPIEDLIIFKLDENDNSTLMINTDTVKLYYPNIYQIIDPDRKPSDRYRICYFYHKATFLEYTPMYDYFYRFLSIRYDDKPIEEIIDTIYRGIADLSSFSSDQLIDFENTFKKIMEYQYFNHQYGEIDFLKRYVLEPINMDKEVVEYKDETLKSWIKVNPYVLRDYVIEQDKLYTPVYHLWTNTLNLSSRLRTDTRQEMGEFGYDLGGEFYVFSFRNDNTTSGKLLDARIFVDGIHAHEMVQERHYFTDYFYIPAELVTDDSYIEVEIFPTYSYAKRIKFNSLDDIKNIILFEPSDKIFPTVQDLYYIEPSGHLLADDIDERTESTDAMGNTDTVKLTSKQGIAIVGDKVYYESFMYSNDFFEITAKYNNNDFVVKTIDPDKPVKFTRLNNFEIKPLSNTVVNKNLIVAISKIPNSIDVKIEKEGFPYLALVENKFKFNIDYIRVFKNGRLMPRQKYLFFSTFSFPRLFFLDYMYPGDMIHIDVTPYRYKEIYYQQDLVKGETLINLKDIITKPFDIRYYDVYMNGRKLGLNNVWTISPWEITLTNLKSLHNLQIFEKERDWEYFGTNYNTQEYYYTIDDLFNSSFITEDEKNQIIKEMIDEAKEPPCNIKPNIDEEDILDFDETDRKYVYIPAFYFNELIPKTFVNPDTKQFNDEIMIQEYTLVDEVYRVHPSDSFRNNEEKNRRINYPDALALNPETYVKGEDEENTQYVYCVGHPENIDFTNEDFSNSVLNRYEEEVIENAD